MYSDNILLLKEEFTPSELTTAITVQLIEKKFNRLGLKLYLGNHAADCTSLMSKIEYRWRKHIDTDRRSFQNPKL